MLVRARYMGSVISKLTLYHILFYWLYSAFWQFWTGLKEVVVEWDSTKGFRLIDDKRPASSSHMYCTTAKLSYSQYCPFLVFHDVNHVIGYTMMDCNQTVDLTVVACEAEQFPKSNLIDKATVVEISTNEYDCPPYQHRVNTSCMTFPQLVTTKVHREGACKCADVGLSIYHIEDQVDYINPTDTKLNWYNHEPLFRNYLKQLRTIHAGENFGFRVLYSSSDMWISMRQPVPVFSHEESEEDYDIGLELCKTNIRAIDVQCPYGFFECRDRTCLVESSRCDGKADCVDGDDEQDCSTICTHPHPETKCTLCSIADNCRCYALYFQCSSGGCISATAICDGAASCADGSDEVMCRPLMYEMPTCKTNFNTSCRVVQRNIHTFRDTCVYSVKDTDARRLHNCHEWQCSSMYKCKAAYCVPMHHICDRMCDCPQCDDEELCMVENMADVNLSCPGMVKCKSGYPCVHRYHVQDGEVHCMRTRDDEVYYPRCPENCSCHGTSLSCTSYSHTSANALHGFTALSVANHQLASLISLEDIWTNCLGKCQTLTYLDCSNIIGWELSFISFLANHMSTMQVLIVSHNAITVLSFSSMIKFRHLTQLYLQHCSIYKVEAGVFIVTFLHILDLSYNKLSSIDGESFGQLHQLKHIFLRNNHISVLDLQVFQESSELLSMDLQNNQLHSVWLDPSRWISTSKLQVLRSNEQILCCIISTTHSCYPHSSVFQSCSALLIRPYNKYILGTIGATTLVLNVGVFGYVVFWKSRQRHARKKQIISSSVYAITDAMFGVHLIALTAADIIYGSDFGQYREVWKRSTICALIESCLSFFLVVTPLLIVHMSVILIYSTINISAKLSDKQYNISLTFLGIFGLVLASIRRTIIMNSDLMEANNFCFPFIVNYNDHLLLQEVFDSIMGSVHMILFIGTLVGLTSLMFIVNKQRKKMEGRRNSKSNSSVQMNLIIYITLTILSKLILIIIWFIPFGVIIFPEVLILLVSCSVSVWPICHPFMHTIRLK